MPLKHEAGVVCIECQDRAIIPKIFLTAKFENPPHIIFCMLQDYLVVAVGSLMWFGDAVFLGCSRQTGCWKTHKSLSVQARNGVQLFCSWVLLSAVAGFLAFPCSFMRSCFLKCHSSNLSAACSGYCPLWEVCGVCYLQTRTQLQNTGFQSEQQVQRVIQNGSPLVRVSL